MKSVTKHNDSGSNKGSVLSELQKEKEKILREMKEREYRKKREQEYKKEKAAPPLPVTNDRHNRERTPPPVIKKIPRVETKSFKEVMEEAEKRSKLGQSNPDKRKFSEISLSTISAKKKPTEQPSNKSSDVPIKKQRMNDYPQEKGFSVPLKPINSARRPEPINSSNNRSIPRSSIDNKINHNSQQNKTSSQIKSNSNQGNSKYLKNGISAQSSSNHSFSKNGIISQSQPRLESQPTKTGILAQTNSSKPMKNGILSQSNSRYEPQPQRSGILAQSNSKIGSQSSAKISSQSSTKSSNVGINFQNPSKNSSRPANDTRNSISTTSLPKKQIDNRSNYNNKPTNNQNYSNSNMNSNSRLNKSDKLPITNRGICAQNGSQYRSSQNFSSKSVYSNPVPQARGIAAQNGGRGILAQSSGRDRVDNYYSGSEEEDEYDSELEGFIDDGEDELTDQMKSEIYKSLNHDPSKYQKISKYDDCKNMESKFNDICKEEIRSYRIAREEDNQELREEEKRLKRKGKLL